MRKKLLDIVRDKICYKHYRLQTEKSYLHWIRRYILFHHKHHPKEMGKLEIEAFLTALAMDGVAPITQNQAFNVIIFYIISHLIISMREQNIQSLKAKQKERVPIVLSKDEVNSNLAPKYFSEIESTDTRDHLA